MLRNSKLLEKNTPTFDVRSFKVQNSYTRSFLNSNQSPTHIGKQNIQYLHSTDTKKIKENQEISNHLLTDIKSKSKYDASMINNRLEQIKKKYQTQRLQISLNNVNPSIKPLEESRKPNNYPQMQAKVQKQSTLLTSKIKQRSYSNLYEQRNKIRADSIQRSKLFESPANLYKDGFNQKQYNVNGLKESTKIQYKYASRFLQKSICDQVRQSKILNENESRYKINYTDQNQKDAQIIDLSNSKYNRYSRKMTYEDKSKPKAQQIRIDSIDKINSKIKQILKCLNQNEKKNYRGSQNIKKQFPQSNQKSSYIKQDLITLSEFKINNYKEEKEKQEQIQKNKEFYRQGSISKYKDSCVRENNFLAESFNRDTFNLNQNQQNLNSRLTNNFNSKDIDLKNVNKQSTISNKQGFLKNSFSRDIQTKQSLNRDFNKLNTQNQSNKQDLKKNDPQKNIFADKLKQQIRKSSIYEKYTPKLELKPDFTVQRSSSVVTKSRNSTSNQCRLSSGKDLDEQIRKIQEKIRKSQQEKKKLNIKFEAMKQYSYKDRSLDKKSHYLKESVANNVNNQQIKKTENSEDKLNQISVLKPFQSNYKNNIPVQKILEKQKDQNQSLRISSIDYKKPISRNETPLKKYQKDQKSVYQNSKLARIDTKFIQKVQTKRLIDCLKNQVNLDQELRGSKQMLLLIRDSQQKWKQLRSELIKNNIQLSESDLRKEFQLTFEQNNPFYSPMQTHESIENIAKKYVISYNHWMNNIKNKFNIEQLTNENFKLEKIDLERKGHLMVQDFVRFLNIQTGTFYRNRDLILLFRRFTKQPTITFNQFLETISFNYSK